MANCRQTNFYVEAIRKQFNGCLSWWCEHFFKFFFSSTSLVMFFVRILSLFIFILVMFRSMDLVWYCFAIFFSLASLSFILASSSSNNTEKWKRNIFFLQICSCIHRMCVYAEHVNGISSIYLVQRYILLFQFIQSHFSGVFLWRADLKRDTPNDEI